MNQDTNSVSWFEIPVTDMDRAKHFYQVAFGIHMVEETMMGIQMAYFPNQPGSGKVSGALAKSDFHIPSDHGTMIYLHADPDLSAVLERIQAEGGQILMPKTLINEQTGWMAIFLDTEGNRVALHAQHA